MYILAITLMSLIMPQVYLLNVVSDNMYENILLFLLLVVIVLALFVAVVLYRAFRTVLKLTNPEIIAQEEKAKKQINFANSRRISC